MAPSLSGCHDPPPEYTVPEPVPPVLIVSQIDPPTTTVVLTTSATITFNVPFRADDAGEALVALFLLDIGMGPPDFKDNKHTIEVAPDPRPFAQQTNRSVVFPNWAWQAEEVSPGCHTMTMILSRVNNFDFFTNTFIDELATARITWLMALGIPCGSWPDPATGSSP